MKIAWQMAERLNEKTNIKIRFLFHQFVFNSCLAKMKGSFFVIAISMVVLGCWVMDASADYGIDISMADCRMYSLTRKSFLDLG